VSVGQIPLTLVLEGGQRLVAGIVEVQSLANACEFLAGEIQL